VAAIDSVVVSVFPVKVSDEDLCKVSGAFVGRFEAVDVVVGDESTMEMKELIKLLVHSVDIFVFNDLFEVFDDRYHLLILLFI
jgi:hypothetical protein